MELEPKQILQHNRFDLFRNRKKKEWWYTGVYDPQTNTYLGFSFFRMDLLDNLHFAVFDPKAEKTYTWDWKGLLDANIPPNQTHLVHTGSRESISYTGSAEAGWKFCLEAKDLSVQLTLHAKEPVFTKFDNRYVDEYALLHFFHLQVSGSIHTSQGSWEFQNALGYYDHCFGLVPRHTRWHWIAVQNKSLALASLMNYGATPQCYTQAYFQDAAPDFALHRWIRLDQDVSFECHPDDPWSHPWKVTSPDMDFSMQILQKCYSPTRVPPVIPFMIKLDHTQCFVELSGRLRVDGHWLACEPLLGVLEEHVGIW